MTEVSDTTNLSRTGLALYNGNSSKNCFRAYCHRDFQVDCIAFSAAAMIFRRVESAVIAVVIRSYSKIIS
jgi:hypothetical protein